MKKIMIIGAGAGGLSTGCYGQMNGFETEIFEMGDTPGGLCTSWRRKGYVIDGCIDWLVGADTDDYFHDVLNSLGALDDTELVFHDYAMNIENREGKNLTLYSDVDKLEEHMLGISKEDEQLIKELTATIRKCAFSSKSATEGQICDFSEIPAEYEQTMYDYAGKFKSPFLREALSVCFLPLDSKRYTVSALIFRLSYYNRKDVCWPMGGSLAFSKRIADKYLSIGGKINYGTKVSSILVEDDQAYGVRLSDGREIEADYVVSAIDGYSTMYHLLQGNYVDPQMKGMFEANQDLQTSLQVSLGIACDLSGEPENITMELEEPITIGGVENTYLYFKHYCYDKTIAPAGKSLITSLLNTDYEYWKKLCNDRNAYEREKQRVCLEVIKAVEKRFPQIKDKVEMTDVATPVTYQKQTGAWNGAYMGWNGRGMLPDMLPGLKRLYLAGQWTKLIGGLPIAILSGMDVVKKICEDSLS